MIKIKNLYKEDQSDRYKKLTSFFKENDIESSYGELLYFSTSGRCELGGNHTDHNKGKTLACSINLDTIACVKKTNDNKIYLISEGFPPVIISLDNLEKEDKEEGTSKALVRGIANYFKCENLNIGGFIACATTKVFKGSGLSSSAAIEVLIATIFNSLYNDNKLSTKELAIIGQYSENVYFGKPSGLLDQLACSTGSISYTDFKNKDPKLINIDFDFEELGYKLLIIALKNDHSNLTNAYSDIVKEMKEVSKYFNKEVLREVDEDIFYKELSSLRKTIKNDRAITRAIHFFEENKRVDKMYKALKEKDINTYLNLVNESGNSSALLLQNIYHEYNSQDLTISLGLAKSLLKGKGASRVHGGGFAGTIFVYVPINEVKDFINKMESSLGYKACTEISIRKYPTSQVLI